MTSSVESPGYIVKWLLWIALIQVAETGENMAPCKKVTRSFFVFFLQIITFKFFESEIGTGIRRFLFFSTIGRMTLLNFLIDIFSIVLAVFGVLETFLNTEIGGITCCFVFLFNET